MHLIIQVECPKLDTYTLYTYTHISKIYYLDIPIYVLCTTVATYIKFGQILISFSNYLVSPVSNNKIISKNHYDKSQTICKIPFFGHL